MPSRTKIDREPVIQSLNLTGSIQKTAIALGLHENTVRQIERALRGLCSHCGQRKHQFGQTKCKCCALRERDRSRRNRAKQKASGKCSMCTKRLKKGSTLFCKEHYARRQRNVRFARHGKAAIEAWDAAGGKCQICGQTKAKQRIDLHHLDEDRTNGAAENLAVLCRDCHYLAHLVLKARDRKAFVAWFEKAYPQHPLR